MFIKTEFYGSTTVGERGQIVIPAELRNKFGINPGDKLLVIAPVGDENLKVITLVDSNVLSGVFSEISDNFRSIMEKSSNAEEEDVD